MDNEKKEPIVPQEQPLPQEDEIVKETAPQEESQIPSVLPEGDDWLDALLGSAAIAAEIGPDEQAVSAAGLTHPDDLELEKILAENWDDVPDAPLAEPEAPAPQQPVPTPPAPVEEIALDEDVLATLRSEFGFEEDAPLPKEMTEDPQEEAPAEAAPVPGISEAEEEHTEPQEAEKEPTPKAAPRKKAPVRKARPDRPKGYGLWGIPHILSTVVWLAIIVAIGWTIGNIGWVCIADLMAFGKPDAEYSITIEEGDSLGEVAEKLGDAGVIRYPELFKLFAQLTGKEERIGVGTFRVNSSLDYNALINNMMNNSVSKNIIDVTIPDGYNCAQIFRLLEKKGVCSAADLEEYAANGELNEFWFLTGVPRGTKYCLEGYLFPNTYTFYLDDSPERVLEKMLQAFDDQFNDRMKEAFVNMQNTYAKRLQSFGFSSSYIKEHPLTLHQVVTLASIVQSETSSDNESYDIASVFYNRLVNPDHQYLGSDATVYYAIGDYFHEKGELTASDIATDSPYNTRNHKGLPPGPISNPGNATLYAVLDPNETSYYYFVYDAKQGFHLFARTYAEHLQNAQKVGL